MAKITNEVTVTCDINVEEVLGNLDAADVLNCMDEDEFLDEIGIDKCKDYFNLRD